MSIFGQPTTQAEIIGRAIGQLPEGMTTEVAQFFLALDLDPADAARANELAAKVRQGDLSAAEDTELESYRHCIRFMDAIKLKARLSLEKKP